jgi:hypothetical protein
VFELPGGWGLNPPVVCLTPKQDALGYPGGQLQPPPLIMMLNRLCVMTMTMNRQMSTPTYFLTVQTLRVRKQPLADGFCTNWSSYEVLSMLSTVQNFISISEGV